MGRSRAEPWLSIVGIGEDGRAGLSLASRAALDRAEVVFGGARHLALAEIAARGQPWPVPFDAEPVLAYRGRPVVALASGDPFWFGAGSVLVSRVAPGEWIAYTAPSTFSHAAAALGWRLEDAVCLGLHAAPFERLIPVLSRGARVICLVRNGDAVAELCQWLLKNGWGESVVTVLTALGGPAEKIDRFTVAAGCTSVAAAPVAVAIEAQGRLGLSRASGLADDLFTHDGQITKRPMRALALSALAPRRGERLWDIGAGSGSISIEWALAGGFASAIEEKPARVANIRVNAEAFGVAHLVQVTQGASPAVLADLPSPDAVFMGGGLTAQSFSEIWNLLPSGARVVAHAVALETQALLTDLHHRHAGDLDRFEVSHAQPLGRMRSWQAARPIVQWTTRK
ncbi:MAG: precorrin-6y C5,15-methyltransferase (decarboxylating) subunit CbiE [Hyphomicrobiaceae bacterium]